jgi:hypothetical protein
MSDIEQQEAGKGDFHFLNSICEVDYEDGYFQLATTEGSFIKAKVLDLDELDEEERLGWGDSQEVFSTKKTIVIVFASLVEMLKEDKERGFKEGDIRYGIGKRNDCYTIFSPNRFEIYSQIGT